MTSFDPADADISLAALFAGWGLADELQRRLAADGYDDARFADGVLFQHLVDEPRTIGVLAERLGVTQQAASKSVADLERRGYVRRVPVPDDARARQVELTERGQHVIDTARRHRAQLAAELSASLGTRRVESARKLLLDVISHLDAETPIRTRRVRPPTTT